MVDDKELAKLRALRIPAPDPEAKIGALHAALIAFDEPQEKVSAAPQGSAEPRRLTSRAPAFWAAKFWREIMQKKLVAAPAVAGLLALPLAGYTALYLLDHHSFDFGDGKSAVVETDAENRLRPALPGKASSQARKDTIPVRCCRPHRRHRRRRARLFPATRRTRC